MTGGDGPVTERPVPRARRRRTSLATRIALLSTGIAVLTALVAGALAVGLQRNADTSSARRTLGRLADVAQAVTGQGTGPGAQRRLRIALQGINVRSGFVRRDGTLVTGAPLVREAVTPADRALLLSGRSLSTTGTVAGTSVYVEGRPTPDGAVVVVQRRADAVAQAERALRRTLVALLIAGAAAAVIGLLVAWRLARPLRRTAEAAHALAAGRRDVELPAAGPEEVAEVSDAINTLAAALRRSEARQREFLLSVSHDLRTPLTSITGYAESLATGVVPGEEAEHVGGVMLAEARRLERLVGDLLDLARLGAQDFRVAPAPVDLVAVARDAATVWSDRCGAAGVRFTLEAPGGGAVVARTDATRLRQVLDGLFDNALRVTPPGAAIVLAVRAEPGAAVVEVRDGGPGLTDDDLAIAFRQGALHQRYRGVRQVGTGLGLAIVHGLVTRLDGRIEAGHAVEGGARFTVWLPYAT